MGLRLERSVLCSALMEISSLLRERNEQLYAVRRTIDITATDDVLQGQAWSSAKTYMEEILTPLVQGMILIHESILRDNESLLIQVSNAVEDDLLDEDMLNTSITRLQGQQRLLGAQMAASDALAPELSDRLARIIILNKDSIGVLQRKIRELHELDNSTCNLYQDAGRLQGMLSQGFAAVEEIGGLYGEPAEYGATMAWAKDIETIWRINHEWPEETLYMRMIGMSSEQAKVLVQFMSRFREYSARQGWSVEESNYQFLRILASTSYTNFMWKESARVLDEKELHNILVQMGYEDNAANLFVEQMYDLYCKSDISIDFIHAMGSLACMRNTRPSTLYHGAGLGPGPGGVRDWSNENATWAGDIASGAMSPEDAKADMDAINIQNRLARDPHAHITDVIDEYYRDLASGRSNRAEEFLANYGNGDADAGEEWLEAHMPEALATTGGAMLMFQGGDLNGITSARQTFWDTIHAERRKAGR